MENTILHRVYKKFKGRKILSSSIKNLEICEADNSLWDAITIVFMDIEIDTESNFFNDYYFRIMYDKVKEIYDKTIKNQLIKKLFINIVYYING